MISLFPPQRQVLGVSSDTTAAPLVHPPTAAPTHNAHIGFTSINGCGDAQCTVEQKLESGRCRGLVSPQGFADIHGPTSHTQR